MRLRAHETVRTLTLAIGLVLIGALPAAAKIKVVATVPDLAAIARDIGGDKVDVTALALHTQDPHFVDARPHLVLELSRADLLLLIGMELEIGWLPTLLTGARNPKVQPGSPGYLDCSQFVNRMGVPQQQIDRSMGHLHASGNPHYMYDPRQAVPVSKAILNRLSALAPEHAGEFKKRHAEFLKRLTAARTAAEKKLASLKNAPVISFHMSFVYVANWLGFVELAYLEPKPGIPPSPTHVARVLLTARKTKARLMLQEQYYPSKTAKLVSSKIPAPLVVIPGACHFNAGQTYPEYIRTVSDSIAAGLKKAAGSKK